MPYVYDRKLGKVVEVKDEEYGKLLNSAGQMPGQQSQGMSTQDAVSTPPVTPQVTQPETPTPTTTPEPQESFISKVGKGAVGLIRSMFQAPEKLGEATGEAASYQANKNMNQQTDMAVNDMITKLESKAKELDAAGDKENANKLMQRVQALSQVQANSQKQTAESIQDTREKAVKGGVGTAAMFIPGGKTGIQKIASGTLAGAGSGFGASEQGKELESTVGGAVTGAATAAALVGAGKVFNWLKPKTEKNVLKRAGDYLREDATKVRVKPNVWGAQKEKAIQETLNDLGIEGSPQQKYELLAPKMEELGNSISSELKANPKEIPFKNVISTFKDKLKSTIRTSDLTSTTAQKEIKGYLTDLYEAADFSPNGNIGSEDFFALKKLVNEDYQGVAKKLANNTPLNDREKVIQVARQVFDDVVSANHPEVKQMTTMQSHLYDAASSLSKARDAVPTTRIAGTTIPTPIIKGGEDRLGAMLQRAGGGVENVANAGMTTANAVSKVAPPQNTAISAMVSSGLSGEQNTDNTQNQQQTIPTGQNSSGNQDQSQQEVQHDGSLPQKTATGYTVTELAQALGQATLAQDKQAIAELTDLYKLESDFQKTQETAKPKAVSSATLQLQGKAKSGLDAITVIDDLLKKSPNLPTRSEVKNFELFKGSDRKLYESAISSLTDAIGGLRTGASVSKEQQAFYRNMLPKSGDTPEVIKQKLDALSNEFNLYLNTDVQDGMTIQQATQQ